MANENENKSSVLPQVIAALAACIGAFSLGTVLAWTSPVLPYLKEGKGGCVVLPGCENVPEGERCCSLNVALSENDASWIGSIVPIGALISGQVTGLLMSKFGRKLTMISMSIPCTIGWILLLLPVPLDMENASLFLVGRFLTGFGTGAFTLAVPAYVSEIAERSIQGALGSCMQLSVTIGILFINGLAIGKPEDVLDWNIITGICIAFPVLMGSAMFFMPESPYFLITRGKDSEAEKSLKWLRGSQYDITEEIGDLQKTFEEQSQTGSVSIKQLLTEGVYLKPFGMAMALMFLQQFSGINAVIFYLQNIFNAAGTEINPPGMSAFIVCIVQVLSTGVAIMVVDRLGRRILLILSAAVMCISLVGLGVFFYMDEHKCTNNVTLQLEFSVNENKSITNCTDGDGQFEIETDLKNVGWLPLVSLIIYIFFFSIGFGPLAWSINAEVFPREAKALGSSIAASFNWLCAFFVTKFQSEMIDGISSYGVYFMYSAVCAVGVAFVLLILPETKGKSPEDMKAYFLGQKTTAMATKPENRTGVENRAYTNS